MEIETSNLPLVSVIIPCFNRPDLLKRTLESVLDQAFTNYEIIVVDDASTDSPDAVVESLNDSRIRIIRHDTNRNAAAARNTGAIAAKGRYIALLDSDDEWKPDHLQRRVDKIETVKSDGIYGAADTEKKGEINTTTAIEDYRQYPHMLDYLLTDGCRACTPSLFFTRASFLDVLFDETLEQYQDFDFNIRYSNKYVYSFDEQATVLVHRSTDESMGIRIRHDSGIKFLAKYRSEISASTYLKLLTSMARTTFELEGRSRNLLRYVLLILNREMSGENLRLVLGIFFPGLLTKLKG